MLNCHFVSFDTQAFETCLEECRIQLDRAMRLQHHQRKATGATTRDTDKNAALYLWMCCATATTDDDNDNDRDFALEIALEVDNRLLLANDWLNSDTQGGMRFTDWLAKSEPGESHRGIVHCDFHYNAIVPHKVKAIASFRLISILL